MASTFQAPATTSKDNCLERPIAESMFNPGDIKVIYCYTIPGSKNHEGLYKIGDTTLKGYATIREAMDACDRIPGTHLYGGKIPEDAARRRIRQQTNTAGIAVELAWAFLAVIPRNLTPEIEEEDLLFRTFRDTEFHNYFERCGVRYVKPDKNGNAHEWFPITAEKAQAALQGFQTGDYLYMLAADLVERGEKIGALSLRPEQRAALAMAKKFLKNGTLEVPRRFLLSAIMRFGKTTVTMQLIMELGLSKVLILTHRPQVLSGWIQEAVKQNMEDKGYAIGSRAMGYAFQQLKNRDMFIFATSIQDIRGSFSEEAITEILSPEGVGGSKGEGGSDLPTDIATTVAAMDTALEGIGATQNGASNTTDDAASLADAVAADLFSKNGEIFAMEWDMVIIDEGHEGTMTPLFQRVVDNLKAKRYLTLSGTPFNLLEGYTEEAMYQWSYADERRAILNFRAQYPGENSPWDNLPELLTFIYELGDVFSKEEYRQVTKEGVYFNFTAFFATRRNEQGVLEFINARDVHRLLSLITKDRSFEDDPRSFPFETVKMKRILAHTFWLLPSVDACAAMKELLGNHGYFADFTVVNVAGSELQGQNALDRVREAIKENPYTITLSVDRLTTGVTVPEWTGVFLLSNTRSVMSYMQTIFRCKSAGILPDGSVKTKGFVFDFSPQRALDMAARSATYDMERRMLHGELDDAGTLNDAVEEHVALSPLYHPLISDDGASFKEVSAVELMSKVYNALSESILRSGFISSALFNADEIRSALKDEERAQRLEQLRGTLGATTSKGKGLDPVVINDSGLSDSTRALGKKPKASVDKDDLEEWREARAALAREKKAMENAMNVMRSISACVPRMIFACAGTGTLSVANRAGASVEDSMGSEISPRDAAAGGEIVAEATAAAPLAVAAITDTTISATEVGEAAATGDAAEAGENATTSASTGVNASGSTEKAREVKLGLYTLPRYIDDASWGEFMPAGVSKEDWSFYASLFNATAFDAACSRVLSQAREALSVPLLERAPYLGELFSVFHAPDRETVLTPFLTANAQMVLTNGGLSYGNLDGKWRASDGNHYSLREIKDSDTLTFAPEWVSRGEEDDAFWSNPDYTVIDPCAKTGFYPLLAALNFYYKAVERGALEEVHGDKDALWHSILERQIFVGVRTPSSASLVERVLTGLDGSISLNSAVVDVIAVNKHLGSDKLLGRMKFRDEQWELLWRYLLDPGEFESTEDRVRDIMAMDSKALRALLENVASLEVEKFDAVVSNPPYQDNVGGATNTGRAVPMWPMFIALAAAISKRASFVTPGRWMRGGAGTGLAEIRSFLLTSGNLHRFIIFQDKDLFEGVGIGEMTIQSLRFETTSDHILQGRWTKEGIAESYFTPSDTLDIFIPPRDAEIVESILSAGYPSVEKKLWVGGVSNLTEKKAVVESPTRKNNHELRGPRIYREPGYFIRGDEKEANVEYVKIYFLAKAMTVGERFLPIDQFKKNKMNETRIFSTWKSIFSKTGAYSLYRNLGPLGEKNTITVDSWVCRGFSSLREVENYNSYLQTYLYRYLVNVRATSHNALANVHRWVPDLADVENPRTGKTGYESDWTDDDLKILFKDVLTKEDWAYIKATAVAADGGRGDYEAGYELPKPYNWDELHPGEEWNGKRHSLTLEDEVDS